MWHSECTQRLYVHLVAYALLTFTISFSLGLCLARPRCAATALLTGADFEGPIDVLSPSLVLIAYIWNVIAIANILQELGRLQAIDDSEVTKRS